MSLLYEIYVATCLICQTPNSVLLVNHQIFSSPDLENHKDFTHAFSTILGSLWSVQILPLNSPTIYSSPRLLYFRLSCCCPKDLLFCFLISSSILSLVQASLVICQKLRTVEKSGRFRFLFHPQAKIFSYDPVWL